MARCSLVFSDKDDRVSRNCSEICQPVGFKEIGDHFSVARGGKIVSVEHLKTIRRLFNVVSQLLLLMFLYHIYSNR